MATPFDNVEHIKKVIQESETFPIAAEKLGILKKANYGWLREFAKQHNVQTKPTDFSKW